MEFCLKEPSLTDHHVEPQPRPLNRTNSCQSGVGGVRGAFTSSVLWLDVCTVWGNESVEPSQQFFFICFCFLISGEAEKPASTPASSSALKVFFPLLEFRWQSAAQQLSWLFTTQQAKAEIATWHTANHSEHDDNMLIIKITHCSETQTARTAAQIKPTGRTQQAFDRQSSAKRAQNVMFQPVEAGF